MPDGEGVCGACRMGAHRGCVLALCTCRAADQGAHTDLADLAPDDASLDPQLQWSEARPPMALTRLLAVLALTAVAVVLAADIATTTPAANGRWLVLVLLLALAARLSRFWAAYQPDPLLAGGR